MFSSPEEVLSYIKDEDIKFVDIRFCDLPGVMQHFNIPAESFDADAIEEGQMFDGSSIAGWKAINESDMLLKPDLTTAYIDPFYQQTTMFLFCDVMNPDTGEPYNRDSRSMAKKALSWSRKSRDSSPAKATTLSTTSTATWLLKASLTRLR